MMDPIPPNTGENYDDVDQGHEQEQHNKATPVVLPVAAVSSVNQWFRVGFIFSVVCIVVGVALHVAEYAKKANSKGWLPPGAEMGQMEMGGMVLVTCGVISAGVFMFSFYDVAALQKAPKKIIFTPAYFDLLHNADWTWAHTKLCLILLLAITIDLMKPATLGFIMPGLLAEYKLTKTQGAILPTIAIAGTVKGMVHPFIIHIHYTTTPSSSSPPFLSSLTPPPYHDISLL